MPQCGAGGGQHTTTGQRHTNPTPAPTRGRNARPDQDRAAFARPILIGPSCERSFVLESRDDPVDGYAPVADQPQVSRLDRLPKPPVGIDRVFETERDLEVTDPYGRKPSTEGVEIEPNAPEREVPIPSGVEHNGKGSGAVQARDESLEDERLEVPRWGVEHVLQIDADHGCASPAARVRIAPGATTEVEREPGSIEPTGESTTE